VGEVVIFFAVAAVFAVGLVFVVRIPAFSSPRARLIAVVTVAAVLVLGFLVGTLWATRAADDETDSRVQTLRRELDPYRTVPLQVLTDDFGATLPAGTEARSDGDGVVVHSEVNRLWISRCVHARVSAAGVAITTVNERCHW
jgi:hypothetical protein